MTPDQLRTFAVVAAHKNISTAALELFLSQPAVSGQMRSLVESFGQPLYHRNGRGIKLTPAGEQLAVYAESVRVAHEKALALRAARHNGEGGILRVGATVTPANYLMPYLLVKFRERYPTVRVAMRSGNTEDILDRMGDLDIGFVVGPLRRALPSDVSEVSWCTDELVPIAPPQHPLARRRGKVSLAALARYPLVWREYGSGVRKLVESIFAAHHVEARNIVLDVASTEGVKEAVRAGIGIGFVSSMAMRRDDPTLVPLRLVESSELRRHFSILVARQASATRACQSLLEISASHPLAQ